MTESTTPDDVPFRVDPRARSAARNNALWCQALCRTHGRPGEFGAGAWVSSRRTPPLYPDAVTVEQSAEAGPLLERIDATAGATLKDSYAALDLRGYGFQVLFEAQWMHRPIERPVPAAPAGTVWRVVSTAEELAAWQRAWSGPEGDGAGLFRPELLADPTVLVLSGHGAGGTGPVRCGAVLNRSDDVVGVSNVFTADSADPSGTWAGLIAAADRCYPGLPLVGYESGGDPELALSQGFDPVGPLRVWARVAAPGGEPVLEVAPPLGDEELSELFRESWPGRPDGVSAFHRVLARSLTWVAARQNERLVGFVNVAWDGGNHAFLLDTTVHPELRGRGLGTRLVRRAAEVARASGASWLHVDYEEQLDGFYRGCGFRPTRAGLIHLDV